MPATLTREADKSLAAQFQNDMNAHVVGCIKGRKITRGDLDAMFDLVKDKSNWKLPIDATLELDEFGVLLVQEAVMFFAGCHAHCNQIRPVGYKTPGKAVYQIAAVGYYAAVGA